MSNNLHVFACRVMSFCQVDLFQDAARLDVCRNSRLHPWRRQSAGIALSTFVGLSLCAVGGRLGIFALCAIGLMHPKLRQQFRYDVGDESRSAPVTLGAVHLLDYTLRHQIHLGLDHLPGDVRSHSGIADCPSGP